MRADAVLSTRKLSSRLAGKLVLNALDLDFFGGELVALIGPNGAGKSSLLHALSGALSLTTGEISFQNIPLQQWSLQQRATQFAVLPQHSTLNFPYRVSEVVALARMPHATGNTCDQEIVQAALASMDLLLMQDQPYTCLSGGEKQRCQLARVLAQIWPESTRSNAVLLLDEPCAGLDPGHIELLVAQLKIFCKHGVAVIMVLHDINFASQHAERILVMDAGSVVAQGRNTQVITEELMNKLFKAHGHVFTHPELGHPVYL